MDYRKLGKTGMNVSVIGLGPEHLIDKPYSQVEEVVHAALDAQVNIMDLFMPHEPVRRHIGKALGGRRDKMIIQGHIGSTMASVEGEMMDICRDLPKAKESFESLMTHLGTDYIDIGMLFYLDSEDDFKGTFENGLADYALDLKKKGIIRAIGFSAHNPVTAKRVIETGIVDMMMFSINPAFDLLSADEDFSLLLEDGDHTDLLVGVDPVRRDLYRLCEQREIGVTVMKTYGGGRLLHPKHSPFTKPLTPGQCIHYALTRPAVTSVLIGCINKEQVTAAVDYINQTAAQRDYSEAVAQFQRGFTGACVYCGHCQPCPAGIDVAALTKLLDIAKLDEGKIPPTIRQHYQSLAQTGSGCIACGDCESRCPFAVKVIENMQYAAKLFGS
ncbi:MAG: aldo/keto reductase [Oscillospiraceae bacterium]|nr:aldo/keto reductase [Oscillospiraceae bacterium]